METVKSWDIFDTLLARNVIAPTDIFSIIENKYPYPGFKKKRILAEQRSNGTIHEIYRQFKIITNDDDNVIELLRKYELQIEKENTIPIQTNIKKMKPEDILVSDMYLTHDEIKELLEYHGLTRYSNLYVYSGGKSGGFAWEELIKKYKITSHTGDNIHSDINMASRYGIHAVYTDSYKFTQLETMLITLDTSICSLIRRFRLSNPYPEKSNEYSLFNEQINYNIPLLLVACRKLADIMSSENRSTVLFLTRDGCLIIKLFKLLYPNFNSIYFHSSRIMNKNINSDYSKYVRSVYNKDTCILFDLHGSFESARAFFIGEFGHLPRVLLFNYNKLAPIFDGLTYIHNEECDLIERLNPDLIGTLCNFIGTRDIRMPLEYNIEYIRIIHNVVDLFCSYISTDNIIMLLISSRSFIQYEKWIDYYKSIIHACPENPMVCINNS
jgi:hypothetical protein